MISIEMKFYVFCNKQQHVCIVLVCSCVSLYICVCVCVWLRDFQWHFLLSRLATKTRILLAIFVVPDSIYIDIAIYVRVVDKLFD